MRFVGWEWEAYMRLSRDCGLVMDLYLMERSSALIEF